MYPMPEFQERNPESILNFMREHSLGLITAIGEDGIAATHVPLLIDSDGGKIRLRGHVMRKTPYWNAFHAASEVLVVFTGPDASVLASWLADLRFGGTWNYMSVHARGKLKFLPEEDLVKILRELKDSHETRSEAKFEYLPADYVPSLIKAIEGFEIEITSTEAVFKLSQNRTPEDFDNIVKELQQRGGESSLVAEEMLKRREAYFPLALN